MSLETLADMDIASPNSYVIQQHSIDPLKPLSWLIWLVLQIAQNFFYYSWFVVKNVIYTLLSTTFNITLSAPSIIIISGVLLVSTYTYVRYSYLTNYSRLPEDSKRQDPILDTFINANESDQSDLEKSYLDQFLAAIKIFGYMDTPVFHELTKSLQTQKLDSGEILFLDQSNGFSICVEGDIQVYARIDSVSNDKMGTDDSSQAEQSIFSKNINHNVVIVDGVKYQLLNIIKSGAPLSSFITVLNLLTDSTQSNITTPNFSGFTHISSSPSRIGQNKNLPNLPKDDKFSLDPLESPLINQDQMINDLNFQTPGLIAIPKDTCTISMIPKESFAKIAVKYPKATSHIIQMILTKLYRVTFQTAHHFLDLTPDIFQTEVNLNQSLNEDEKLPQDIKHMAVKNIDFFDSDKRKQSHNASKTGTILDKPNLKKFNNFSESPSVSPFLVARRSSNSVPLKSELNEEIDSGSLDCLNLEQTDSFKKFKIRSNTNPADSLSNIVTFKQIGDLHSLSNSKNNVIVDDNFVDDTEFKSHENACLKLERSADNEDLLIKREIIERICKMIGLDKDNLSSTGSGSSSSTNISGSTAMSKNSTFSLNSPIISVSNGYQNSITSSIRLATPVMTKSSKSKKVRTFSTTSLEDLKHEQNNSNQSSASKKVQVNYEDVNKEFVNDLKLFKVPKGKRIITSKEQTPGIYYVISGSLDVTFWRQESELINTYLDDSEVHPSPNVNKNEKKLVEEHLYSVTDGDIAGYLGTLIGSKSFVDVTASEDTYVAFLSREFFEYLNERYPKLQLGIAKLLLKILNKKLYLTDYALEWVHSSAGNVLYKEDDPANGIYIVLNGRLRSLSKNKSNSEYIILGEYGQGESMGEMEVLTKSKRLNTVVSIRDSELARIPRTLFEIIALSNPSTMVNVSRIVAQRVRRDCMRVASQLETARVSTRIHDDPIVQNMNNYRTLTILPVTYGSIPLLEFGERLAMSLEKVGKSVKILNQSAALSNLGKYAFDKLAKMKQGGYFSELEEKYDIIIYLCDSVVNSTWTTTCIQQGDCILLLADAVLSYDVGEYERLLSKTKTTARTELVLLHPEKYVEPGLTHKFLKNRIWVHSHHHIQLDCGNIRHPPPNKKGNFTFDFDNWTTFSKRITDTVYYKVENIVNKTEYLQFFKPLRKSYNSKKYYQPLQEHKDDFMRLARLLTGQAIGLVLGGGGARGISHVGIIKALDDHGIPVDIIGGTSIGSFVGGLYAKDYDFVPVFGRAKIFSGRMTSVWRSLMDLTIPLTSYFTGHEFNRGLWKSFGDSRIEDFWIKYYANSTNLTNSTMEIHTSGYAWRYIRASMTLASLLPPLTDKGDMLMDGGYLDNLTVDEMQRRGAKHIIAVDVGSIEDRSPMEYGNTLSGFWVLINRLNPFSVHANVPTMTDIQLRLTYVSSVTALERAKNSKNCWYLRPPIDDYATLAFNKFDEIYEVGFNYGNEKFKDIVKQLKISKKKKQVVQSESLRMRRYSV